MIEALASMWSRDMCENTGQGHSSDDRLGSGPNIPSKMYPIEPKASHDRKTVVKSTESLESFQLFDVSFVNMSVDWMAS